MGTHFPFPNPSKLAPPTPSSPRPGLGPLFTLLVPRERFPYAQASR